MTTIYVPWRKSPVPTTPESLPSLCRACTLVLPTVSVANIGQLTVDLLIVSLMAVKLGYLRSSNIHSLIGADAVALSPKEFRGTLTLPLEVYYSEQHRMVLVQQRSPVLRGWHGEFAKELHTFLSHCQFNQVIVVTSASIHQLRDRQIQADSAAPVQVAWSAQPTDKQAKAALALGLQTFEPQTDDEEQISESTAPGDTSQSADDGDGTLVPPVNQTSTDSALQSSYPFDSNIVGGGVTRWLWPLLQASSVRASLLSVYSAEGDNARESSIMAQVVHYYNQLTNDTLSNDSQSEQSPLSEQLMLKAPFSWQFVFGSAPDAAIYL